MPTFGSGPGAYFSKVPLTNTLISPFCFCSLHVNCIIFKTPILNKNRTARGQLSYRNLRETARKTTQETVENFSILPQLYHVWLFKAFTNTCTIPLYKTKEGSCRKIALLLIFFFIARTLRSSYKGTQKRWPDKIECILLGLGYSVYVLQWYSSLNSLQRSAMKKKEKPFYHQVKFILR